MEGLRLGRSLFWKVFVLEGLCVGRLLSWKVVVLEGVLGRPLSWKDFRGRCLGISLSRKGLAWKVLVEGLFLSWKVLVLEGPGHCLERLCFGRSLLGGGPYLEGLCTKLEDKDFR